jgi:hypothetical protein
VRGLFSELLIETCGRVVLYFANVLGYIAREAISRDELDKLIDTGITPEGLAEVIRKRIEEKDGLILGYHSLGDTRIPVKLTQNYQDRHIYIIGKSGSGKTNLIRQLIYQHINQGHGVGVLVPEPSQPDKQRKVAEAGFFPLPVQRIHQAHLESGR